MPDYLVIETTHGEELRNAGVKITAASVPEAAQLVNYQSGYSVERTFKVFAVDDGVEIGVQEERKATLVDKSDPTDTKVLATYGEAEMEQLLSERAAAEEAAKAELEAPVEVTP